jgi:transcriptional regulator with XRE-family HTH domain
MAKARTGTTKGFADPRYKALIGRLVAQRKHLGLSQAALAERLGIHQQFVGRYELGERRLDVVEFADVATALGLTPADLIAAIE